MDFDPLWTLFGHQIGWASEGLYEITSGAFPFSQNKIRQLYFLPLRVGKMSSLPSQLSNSMLLNSLGGTIFPLCCHSYRPTFFGKPGLAKSISIRQMSENLKGGNLVG